MSRHLALSLAVALALGGCALPGLQAPGSGPAAKLPIKDPVTGKIVSNQPVEALNGIEFRPLTVANAKYLSGQGGGSVPQPASAGMEMAAPMAPAAPMADGVAKRAAVGGSGGNGGVAGTPSTAGGAYSGNVWGGYGYRYYFGFGMGSEQMALVSVQEAETKGAKGGLAEIVAGVVGPVVRDWALDARLTEAGSTLTNEGALYVEPQVAGATRIRPVRLSPLEGSDGWRLVYLSSARSEMLQFIVTPAKTTLVRMRWAPLDLAPERIKVDSPAAVASVVKAVSDKGFASVEERTMKDYFLGHDFEQPKTGEYDGDTQKTEVLYKVPANARWNVSLQQMVGKLVWELNWHAPDENQPVGIAVPGSAVAIEEPAVASRSAFRLLGAPVTVGTLSEPGMVAMPPGKPAPCLQVRRKETSTYTHMSGSAMVDAETGSVIRFTRPTRVTNTWENFSCEEPRPEPQPLPIESVKPSPTPSASASTDPIATTPVQAGGEASGTADAG